MVRLFSLNVGLCIALKDIIRVGDSIILPGDGASHTEILFRYIVFRPRIGDIITGKIRSCSREGVHGWFQLVILVQCMRCYWWFYEFSVTLGFFDDILIPPTALQHPSRFEEAEQAWVWIYKKKINFFSILYSIIPSILLWNLLLGMGISIRRRIHTRFIYGHWRTDQISRFRRCFRREFTNWTAKQSQIIFI